MLFWLFVQTMIENSLQNFARPNPFGQNTKPPVIMNNLKLYVIPSFNNNDLAKEKKKKADLHSY